MPSEILRCLLFWKGTKKITNFTKQPIAKVKKASSFSPPPSLHYRMLYPLWTINCRHARSQDRYLAAHQYYIYFRYSRTGWQKQAVVWTTPSTVSGEHGAVHPTAWGSTKAPQCPLGSRGYIKKPSKTQLWKYAPFALPSTTDSFHLNESHTGNNIGILAKTLSFSHLSSSTTALLGQSRTVL